MDGPICKNHALALTTACEKRGAWSALFVLGNDRSGICKYNNSSLETLTENGCLAATCLKE